LDEAIALDYALSGEADLIVNIVDASNLERNLYLTTQLMEMRVPVVLALNMLDMAREAGVRIDLPKLEKRLGCPVVPLVAAKGEGVEGLKRRVVELAAGGLERGVELEYAPPIEEALAVLEPQLSAFAAEHEVDARWLGVKLLENDPGVSAAVEAGVRAEAERLQAEIEAHLDEEALQLGDRIVLNRFLGIPIFLAVMYLLFVLSFNGGNIFLDFFSGVTHAVFVSGLAHVLQSVGSPQWLITLLATSVGGSLELVSTFIAPIGMTFLFLSILEDSGYMARAAFVMDRFMRRIGLPGKAFVPMIVGFGCNVPAVMATRTLEEPRERLVSALMQPFMSCSARLVIYMAFVTVFFREHGGQIVFGLYVLGIVAAIFTAFLLKRTALKGDATPFVMEMPAYHIPTLRGMARSTWDRLSVFLLRVGKVIIIASVVVTALSSFSPTGRPLPDDQVGDSALAAIGKTITPVFHPMGITQDNWPATVGLLSGVVVKEIVVGTLNGVYSKMDAGAAAQSGAAAPPFDFWGEIRAAVATVPENAKAFARGFLDPLGFSQLGSVQQSNLSQAAAQQSVDASTLTRMGALFTVPAAVAYLIFVLLYLPCVNTMAAIYRETGSRAWTAFAIVWGIELAYGLAVLYYQFATFGAHPAQSLGWLAVMLAVFAATVWALRRNGRRRELASA
ncbi:MAG: ferrous iron transport protein B, partial [Acidihalobacter sp.]